MNTVCIDCSKPIVGFRYYKDKNYECYDCRQPCCDKCYAEDSLISFGSDNNQRTFCSRCLQEKINNAQYTVNHYPTTTIHLKCNVCSEWIDGFNYYENGKFKCYDCYQPCCDKCYAEDSLISFGKDDKQTTFCSRCLQEKLINKEYKFSKKWGA